MKKSFKIIISISLFISITFLVYFIYIYNLDFRVVVKNCSSSSLDSYEYPIYEVMASEWKRNKLTINTKIKTNCGGVKILGDFEIVGNDLYIKYFEKSSKLVASCDCTKNVDFIIKNITKNDYNIKMEKGIRNILEEKVNCEKIGGVWKTFLGGCSDYCIRGLSDCLPLGEHDDCECGENKCMEGNKCIVNPDYLNN